ncbi:uncharacterized protein MELLADRAFT_107149 [Melampsora larici-populina 98AG31]|uniref:Uncharacterized protein n=1 Tax=Melampsora larici-populina (strain 98AG31 / pathotype 3-4-7) TaxID=747676 RepID=F4RP06_MELLP|nr:uncharacterized protein MELLADRAFT_107149 [Melampsora larici-populina 98AG31]EGG05739.1 hypothetical protein MELLADRAFT_107149 [Melampsora larici-populina 98AG31]
MADQEQSSSQGSSTHSNKLKPEIKTSTELEGSSQASSESKASRTDNQESSDDSLDQTQKGSENDPDSSDETTEDVGNKEHPNDSFNQIGTDPIPNTLSKRPELDCKVANRFINHSISSSSTSSSSTCNGPKRKLNQDEIEDRLENGRIGVKVCLPEIRQVLKGGGWNDEESDSSDDEDLKVFD